MKIEVIPTEIYHIEYLLDELKNLSNEDAYRFGFDTNKVLIKTYNNSVFVKTAIVNDEIVAVWGVLGTYLGSTGYPWSLMSPKTEHYPFRFTSLYRKELNKMLELFPVLIDMVDIKHTKVLRMLRLMGFTFGEPAPFNGGIYIQAERRVKCQVEH